MKYVAPVLLAYALAMVCLTDPEGLRGVGPEGADRPRLQGARVRLGRESKVSLSNGQFLCVRESVADALKKLDTK